MAWELLQNIKMDEIIRTLQRCQNKKNNIALELLQKTTSRQGSKPRRWKAIRSDKKQYAWGTVAKYEILMNIYKMAKQKMIKRVQQLYTKSNNDK